MAIKLKHLRTLTLNQPLSPERCAHLSAASGLVKIGNFLYVVADDEKFLTTFSFADTTHGILHRIMPGDLPVETEARKAHKHDFETLLPLPADSKYPHSALLVLGSGSSKQRKQGIIVPLLVDGNLSEHIELIDLRPLYALLKNEPGKINIEGAVVVGDTMVLFQRGNKNNVNASIQIKLEHFYHAITSSADDLNIEYTLTEYDLGEIDSVPLCFTDATALPDGTIAFTAAAENTSDAYLDGACLGSVIGFIAKNGKLQKIYPVAQRVKLEGITAEVIDEKLHLLLVTDPDNADLPADLYSAVIEDY